MSSYTIKKILAQNFAEVKHVEVTLDKVNFFIGNNGQGKSTTGIDALQALFEDIKEKAGAGQNPIKAPKQKFIGKAGKSADIIIEIENTDTGEITIVKRHITASKSEITAETLSGTPVDTGKLREIFNYFLISPAKFINLTPFEQSQALGIDISSFKEELASLKIEATILKREAEMRKKEAPETEPLGKDEPVFIEEIDQEIAAVDNQILTVEKTKASLGADNLEQRLLAVKQKGENAKQSIVSLNSTFEKRDKEIAEIYLKIKDAENFIAESKKHIELKINEKETIKAEIEEKKKVLQEIIEEFNDVKKSKDELDVKKHDESILLLNQAKQILIEKRDKAIKFNKEIEEHENNKKLWAQYESALADMKKNHKAQEEVKIKIKDYVKSKSFNTDRLAIDDDGGLTYNGKYIDSKYFSAGELAVLVPVLISATNPSLRYVYIENWMMIDDENKNRLLNVLKKANMQIVVEVVGDVENSGLEGKKIFFKNGIVFE